MRHFILFFTFLLCAVLISGCIQGTTSDNSKVGTSSPLPSISQSISPEIDITSNPSDGQVYLDNEYKGNTPNTIRQVSIGSHKIEVRHSGFLTWSTSFIISPENFTYSFSPSLINETKEVTGTVFNGDIFLNLHEHKIFTSPGGDTTITIGRNAAQCGLAVPLMENGMPMRSWGEPDIYKWKYNPNDQIVISLEQSGNQQCPNGPYKISNVSIIYRKTVKNE
jgi:hypothetical protein